MNGRRRKNRRHRSCRYYSLDELLSRQPCALRKDCRYRELLEQFLSSESLQRLRISSRCFRLMDKAQIDPENLPFFYRTYHLPQNSFFPLFLGIKRSYLAERQKWQEEREIYILKRMKALPTCKIRFVRFLADWEQSLNGQGEFPFWMNHLYPETKKRVHQYEKFTTVQWEAFFREYLKGMLEHYHLKIDPLAEKLTACCILELIPRIDPLCFPDRQDILRSYRMLCRRYHPDRGGDPALFVLLQRAREVLCPV